MVLLYWTWLLNILRTKYEHELFHYNLLFYICILRKCFYTHSGWNTRSLALTMRPKQTEWEHRLKKNVGGGFLSLVPKEPQTLGQYALKGLQSDKGQCRELRGWADFLHFNKCINVIIFGHPGTQQPSVQKTQVVPLMVETSFQISYVAVLNPSIPKYDLYGEKVFTDTHLKWGHSVSPEPDWLVPLRRGNLNRCGEDWWGSSTNQQRMLCEKKDPSTSLEDARYTFPPPQAQEETKDVGTLILRF